MTTRAYVSAVGDDAVELIEVDDELGVFRREADDHVLVAPDDDDPVDLGFDDISVSRMREDGAPVRLGVDDDALWVHNVDNASTVYVEQLTTRRELDRGERTTVTDDCVVEPGRHTALRVSLESVAAGAAEDAGGIPVPALVSALCDGFRTASRDSRSEALAYGNRLLGTVREYPVDDHDYDDAVETLKARVDQLDIGEGETINDERRRNNRQIAERIDAVYDRHR